MAEAIAPRHKTQPVNSMWIKSEAKRPRPLRGLQVDFSLVRNVSYAVR